MTVRISTILFAGIAFALSSVANNINSANAANPNDAPLHLQVFRSGPSGFNVASVLVTGKKDAVLIDAQFTRSDAHRLVAQILESGKELKTVYISQGDPDYYFGLEVIKQAFPNAKVLATQATVDHIKTSLPTKLKVWGPQMGDNGPKNPIVPDVLPANSFDLEGQKIEVVGSDGPSPLYTFVWIPVLKAVVGGVRVYGRMHLWTTDVQSPASRQCWTNDLKKMQAFNPSIVVPGHAKDDTAMDVSEIKFSEDYLVAFGQELTQAKTAENLIRAMKKRYPNAAGDEILELGAKVNMKELDWESAPDCKG